MKKVKVPDVPPRLDPDDELLRRARAGQIRLPPPNAKAVYTRPPKERRLPDDVVLDLLDEVRGDSTAFRQMVDGPAR